MFGKKKLQDVGRLFLSFFFLSRCSYSLRFVVEERLLREKILQIVCECQKGFVLRYYIPVVMTHSRVEVKSINILSRISALECSWVFLQLSLMPAPAHQGGE